MKNTTRTCYLSIKSILFATTFKTNYYGKKLCQYTYSSFHKLNSFINVSYHIINIYNSSSSKKNETKRYKNLTVFRIGINRTRCPKYKSFGSFFPHKLARNIDISTLKANRLALFTDKTTNSNHGSKHSSIIAPPFFRTVPLFNRQAKQSS